MSNPSKPPVKALVRFSALASVGASRPEQRAGDGIILGVILVLSGGACYGVLATIVRLAYQDGFTPAEVLSSQFLIGAAVLGVAAFAQRRFGWGMAAGHLAPMTIGKLILGGTSIGLTGTFYYLSVAHAFVSLSIVLLMQSVWMGVVLEAILTKQLPDTSKLAGAAIVLIGSVMATNLLAVDFKPDTTGVIYGLLAAASYTAVMWCSKHVGVNADAITRGFLMIVGGAIAALAIALPQLVTSFDLSVFWKWGWVVALFGTILPPFLFARGVPLTGVGLAAILGAVELPVAIIMARTLLGERFSPIQWLGVGLIVAAIVVGNRRRSKTGGV
ncbi:DMT family transporter [Mesorhizobium australicum]|uniref:DMT family transporter n=1 Tax=Mesorhizobium australicum TaxID=536018 RepID=UPI0033381B42